MGVDGADLVVGARTLGAQAWDVSLPAGATALAVAAAAAIGMWLLWRSTAPNRPAAGPATMELRPEPPAVVDLLTGGFEVEDDAVPATVVDLAARGHLDIDEIGHQVLLRPRQHGSHTADVLTPYERRVLRHVARHVVDGAAPAQVLTIGPRGTSQRWFRGFVREVAAHGRSLGLCRRRWGVRHLVVAWALVGVAWLPASLVGSGASRSSVPTDWAQVGNLLVGLAYATALGLTWVAQRISRSDAQVDTPAGLEAAAHWLGVRDHYRSSRSFEDKPAASVAIWDRHLAYATALGVAPVVQRQLPFEVEHDRHAWSLATGQWRRVKVRYRALVPGWGQHPLRVLLESLLRAGIAGALSYGAFQVAGVELDEDTVALTPEQQQWLSLGAMVVAVALAAVAAYNLGRALLGAADLLPRRTVEGELVRKRELATGHRLPKIVQLALWAGRDEHGIERDRRRRRRLHLAIDDGTDERIVAVEVRRAVFDSVAQGARVRARVSPRLGYVASLEVLSPPRASAADERAVAHPLAAEAARRVAPPLAGGAQAASGRLQQTADDHGRPEAASEAQAAVARGLAEGRAQLEQLRRDPRMAGNPAAELLDAFLGTDPTGGPDADGAGAAPPPGG